MTVVELRGVGRQVERDPLAMAIVLSLLIHLGLYGGWRLGKQLGWWQYHPQWLTQWTRKLSHSAAPRMKPKPPVQAQVLPMTFVEVDPETATAEAPDQAKYYSSKNSKAANPDPKDRLLPKVDGKQDQAVRLMDNEKPKPFPLQPSPPKPPPTEAAAEPKPKSETPEDLALLRKKDPTPAKEALVDTGTGEALAPPKERPRTLAAARAQKAMLSGEKIRQDGGVSAHGQVSFDAKATTFGEYDLAFIVAVEQCWHNLLDEHQGTQRPGKVVVDFRLTYDGRITDMKVQDNEVGEILSMLCQSAILNPQPYPRWPTDMRKTIGGNSREIRFTFYYN